MFNKDAYLGWNTNPDNKNTFELHALNYSRGYTDVFILSPNSDDTKLRNLHCCVGYFHEFRDKSILFPTKKQIWNIYNNFPVNIPNKYQLYLIKDYDENYMIPDVNQQQLDCPNVDDDLIKEWMDDITSNYNLKYIFPTDSSLNSSTIIQVTNNSWIFVSCIFIGAFCVELIIIIVICFKNRQLLLEHEKNYSPLQRMTNKHNLFNVKRCDVYLS